MFKLAEAPESTDSTVLANQLDRLSTRLIIDGVETLSAEDFAQMAAVATHQGRPAFAAKASQLAASLHGPAGLAAQEVTRAISSGLATLHDLLDHPEDDPARSPQAEQLGSKQNLAIPQPVGNRLSDDVDLVREFITEAQEHLSTVERQMLLLEQEEMTSEGLNAVFRAFHTIKGLAGFLEFAHIQALAHEVETLLDLARNNKLQITPAVVDVMLDSTDVARQEIANIEAMLGGLPQPPTGVSEHLLQRIRDISVGKPAAAPQPEHLPGEGFPLDNASSTLAYIGPERRHPPAAQHFATQAGARHSDAASIRIDTGKLDQLMDMVGEMVIAQTLIGHSPALADLKDAKFLRELAHLAQITADVQRITTGMRMVPIGLQFQKTARMVRDLSRKAGKQIVLETSGEDTELDKTIAEELSDPLLHMVRNSIDHGIETPAERIALGKDPTARIRVSAYHQAGQIVLAISDDGRGLNCERILAKAQSNGLIAPGAQLSENEIFQLIFEAGFSTAEKVTDISGRGVGMDVVRKHVQKLRGRIEIQSRAGQGTTFFLKLPLTLAIIEGLVVAVGAQRYVVPIFCVKEMLRPTPAMITTVQGKGEMALVRDRLLPVVRLHSRFQVEPRTLALSEGVLIVAESEGRQFCLFVDDLVGKQEVVIKSLGQSFAHVVGVAGCAILGDGRVGLILDIDGVSTGKIS